MCGNFVSEFVWYFNLVVVKNHYIIYKTKLYLCIFVIFRRWNFGPEIYHYDSTSIYATRSTTPSTQNFQLTLKVNAFLLTFYGLCSLMIVLFIFIWRLKKGRAFVALGLWPILEWMIWNILNDVMIKLIRHCQHVIHVSVSHIANVGWALIHQDWD